MILAAPAVLTVIAVREPAIPEQRLAIVPLSVQTKEVQMNAVQTLYVKRLKAPARAAASSYVQKHRNAPETLNAMK